MHHVPSSVKKLELLLTAPGVVLAFPLKRKIPTTLVTMSMIRSTWDSRQTELIR
jgi:hypothetical protein